MFNGYDDRPSYKKLVQDFCKISLDKSLQKEDWLKRPINNERINYLINDVYYLKIIFNKLNNKLVRKNKVKLFNKLIKKEIFKISHEDYPIIFKKKLGNDILKNKKFFFDTEFERRSTYKAIISVIVIFDGKNIGIIDCLEKNINFKKIFKFLNKKKYYLGNSFLQAGFRDILVFS